MCGYFQKANIFLLNHDEHQLKAYTDMHIIYGSFENGEQLTMTM